MGASTLNITALSITSLSVMTLIHYRGLVCDTHINDTEHNIALHYAESRILFIVMLRVSMLNFGVLSVIMLNVNMLRVLAPFKVVSGY